MADEPHSTDTAEQKPGVDPRYRFGPTVHAVILRLPAVRARTGLSRATIYRKMANDEFPRARQLGTHSVGWVESEIDSWVTTRLPTGKSD